ncbi:hypothetical protein DRA43_12530 [Micromonospora provocatoris]|nr:PPC domain-containing protein [Micromonospora provocatoris]RBJ05044.1 hypothetical protein DRA43_12530 [Micromonospora provocatoris]
MPECGGTDTRTLDRNCQRSGRSATAGNYDYLYIYLPAGVSTLTIAAAGGTGNCDLYYSPSSWATTSNATRSSAGAGNTESLAIPSPAAGYHLHQPLREDRLLRRHGEHALLNPM